MSQTNRILADLRNGQRITSLSAFRKYKCLRLASRILEIRKNGFKVKTTMVEHDRKKVASYKIEAK